jgi:hypothetical protein
VLATALGLGGWVLASRADGQRPIAPPARVGVPHGAAANSARAAARHRHARAARPVRLVIPAIGVSSRLLRLGLTSSGDLQVPPTPTLAGWYTGSPRPGAVGSSVIAGHIDSRSGPGVFYRLRTMRRGEHIYVVRADRSVASFKVIAVHAYPKDRFPRAQVYGPVPDAELRLITCGGLFDYATGAYLSNVVVYAILISH